MNCLECEEYFSAFLERSLDSQARARMEAHLAACPKCRRELAELRDSLHALKALPASLPAKGFAGQVAKAARKLDNSGASKTEIVDADSIGFNVMNETEIVTFPAWKILLLRLPPWAMGAAAAVMLVSGVMVGRFALEHEDSQPMQQMTSLEEQLRPAPQSDPVEEPLPEAPALANTLQDNQAQAAGDGASGLPAIEEPDTTGQPATTQDVQSTIKAMRSAFKEKR